MNACADAKHAARAAARLARAAAAAAAPADAAETAARHVVAAVDGLPGIACVAGYLPIRGELDPRPAMVALLAGGRSVGVPEIVAPGRPLDFRAWSPDAAVVAAAYGTEVPRDAPRVVPDLLLVPLLAFDARGHRLGYGGGFYDRTIAALRAAGRMIAFGFAYAGQGVAELPAEATDMPLDAIVTEAGILRPPLTL